MGTRNGKARKAPFEVKTVHGQPYDLDGRKLIPVARIVSAGKARATIGPNRISGWGGGFARITPVAILEETAEGERYIPISDATTAAVRGMLAAMLAGTLFFTFLRWRVRRLR